MSGHHGHSHDANGNCVQRRRKAPPPDPEADKRFVQEAMERLQDLPAMLDKEDPPARMQCWFVLSDPCGLVCAIITHFVVQFVNYVTVFRVIAPWLITPDKYRWGILGILFFETIICLIVWSHLKCMLSDPGTIPRVHVKDKLLLIQDHMNAFLTERGEDGRRLIARPWCSKCSNYKPLHTHHCSYCSCCIEEFDHHCPWMNNCIGKRNHKFFMLFLLYVGSGSFFAILMTVIRMYSCFTVEPMTARLMDCRLQAPATMIFYIVSIVLSLLFLLFVSCMSYEQLEEIADMTTMVEKKKGMSAERVGVWGGLELKFREKFSCRWFIPVQYNEARQLFPPLSLVPKYYGYVTIVLLFAFTCLGAYWMDAIARFVLSGGVSRKY